MTSRRPPRRVTAGALLGSRSDVGSGSVLTLAVASLVLVLALALGLLVQAVEARARAQSAADLSALAGARQAQRAAFGEPGMSDPCARAAEVATHNGASLAACAQPAPGRVRVEVQLRTPLGAAHASALAGPSR